jgi:LCP family protein required for cell wall assembly
VAPVAPLGDTCATWDTMPKSVDAPTGAEGREHPVGRPPKRPVRRSRRRRIVLWVGAALGLVLLAATGTAVGMYYHFNGQIARVHNVISRASGPITRSDGSTAPPAAPAANYLVVGSDSRVGANRKLPHTGGASCHCADTIIVVHVPKGHAKAIVVSIPRDSWVTIPAHTTSDGHPVGVQESKINAALAIGGPALLVQTVQALTGLHIDHYVQVDFAGFVDMVNAVHGVDVCLSAPAQDWHTGIDLSAGYHHLDGVTTLEYVRQRHGLPNGDLDRIKRQQAVVGQLVGKVVHAGILLHPLELTRFLDVVTKSVTVDDHLSFGDLRRLASTFGKLDRSHVAFATVPVTDEGAVRDGQSVVLLDQAGVDRMFNAVARGRLPARHGSGGTQRGQHPTTVHGVRCLP